jgi:polar amino acid transport system substrate-binding protein
MPAPSLTLVAHAKRALVLLTAIVAAAIAAMPAAALMLLTEENPPFSFTDKGKLQGSATEVVRGMVARAGVPASFEVLPWDKAYVRAQGQKDACLFATARLENRERLFLWVGPIATSLWAVYGKSDFGLPIRGVKDLAPYKIGTVVRDAKNEFLRENAVNELRAVREDAQNPPRLLLPRDHPDHIDLWITDLHAGRETARTANVTGIKVVFVANELPLYLACNPQTDRKIVKALADALEGMRADGALARINAEYDKRFPR